jgi:hypothetical protein
MSQQPDATKSLEMRLAAIEDKLAQLHITDEEMATYNKVASILAQRGGGGAATMGAQPSPQAASIFRPISVCSGCWTECTGCWIHPITPISVCGPCGPFQGGAGGGVRQFGGFGM